VAVAVGGGLEINRSIGSGHVHILQMGAWRNFSLYRPEGNWRSPAVPAASTDL
jgi:hypothetical protein